MKKSKQAEGGNDMISKLPDDVLQLILSRLQGTEEAIRTSIFSRRWRYVWTSVPTIDIDHDRAWKPSKEFDSDKFREFVDWVLANKSSIDLDSFRLCCSDIYSMSTIRPWIDAAVMRKVKLLDLAFRPVNWSEKIELPQCLATCDSLEVLKLCLFADNFCLPNIKGFQALRVLELKEIDLAWDNYNVVKYFLESCPLLEDLSLIECFSTSLVISCPKLKNLRIDNLMVNRCECVSYEICCPKLEFLRLKGFVAEEFLFKSLYSLNKAVIHPYGLSEMKSPPFDWFARISRVEYLSISLDCITELFDPRVGAPISLPNLRTLEITTDYGKIQEVISFLKCVPDLESLHLIIPKDAYGLEKWNLEEAETINILTRHLKNVEFLGFDEEKPKLDVARALLEHGNLLKEMVFSWGDEMWFNETSGETMNKVSKFHKASSTVKLTSVFNPT